MDADNKEKNVDSNTAGKDKCIVRVPSDKVNSDCDNQACSYIWVPRAKPRPQKVWHKNDEDLN